MSIERLPEWLRDTLVEISSLERGDVAAVGTVQIGPALAAYILEMDDLYQTMLALTKARELNPNIMKLLANPATMDTLQLMSKKESV